MVCEHCQQADSQHDMFCPVVNMTTPPGSRVPELTGKIAKQVASLENQVWHIYNIAEACDPGDAGEAIGKIKAIAANMLGIE